MKKISGILPLVALVACNNYGLDDRIRNSLNGSGVGSLNLTAPASQFILIQNKTTTLATLPFAASGGNQPYTFTLTTSNIPANMVFTVNSSGLVTVMRNTSIAYPPSIQIQDPLPVGSITVTVTDSSGTTNQVTYPVAAHFKRAFITSVQDGTIFASWSGSFSACANPTPIAAANCACRARAQAANLLNVSKYRAWLSYTTGGVDAKCNITDSSAPAACTPNANDGGPWYRTDGLRIADNIGTGTLGLLNAVTPLANPLSKDEFGGNASFDAMTGTDGPGTVAGAHCGSWTTGSGCATRGDRTVTGAPGWTNFTGTAAGPLALYCFEAD